MNTLSNPLSTNSPSTAGRWRFARRLLIGMGILATVVAAFYTIENWRGRREWENRRRELQEKGEVLDWSAFTPAPVPDEQNFFKAPRMKEWFVKDSLQELASTPSAKATNTPPPFSPTPRKDVIKGGFTNLKLAEIKVVTPQSPLGSSGAEAVLRFDDPTVREYAARLLAEAVGPGLTGAASCVLLARPLEQFKPRHWVIEAASVPSLKELTDLFPANPLTDSAQGSGTRYLVVETVSSNVFSLNLKGVYGATDYLVWTEPLNSNLDLVREALLRPYARIDCDYQLPYAIGIPNFITIRTVVQLLAQRAQSHLLLGQPEAAWHELALVHDLSQILLVKPSGKPITLVGAMIHVAVQGLYANVVEDGLRLHAWREPELLAIEKQLKDTALLAPVVEAFREGRAATCRTFESTRRSALVKLFELEGAGTELALRFMPRGWFYQNMARGAQLEQETLSSVDLTHQLVRPRQVSEVVRGLPSGSAQHSPYRFLLALAIPNMAKALETAAAHQTLINQARIGCALERFRMAHGNYPDTLEALTPSFIDRLPQDLIGGQPLKYSRTQTEGYLLYSVGWDEKDDGGTIGKSRDDGDWVWDMK